MKIWFQNRRTKWKKQENISNSEAAEHKIGGPKSTEAKKGVPQGSAGPKDGQKAMSDADSPSMGAEIKHMECKMDKTEMKSDNEGAQCDTRPECTSISPPPPPSTQSPPTLTGMPVEGAQIPADRGQQQHCEASPSPGSCSPQDLSVPVSPERPPVTLTIPQPPPPSSSPPHLLPSYQDSQEEKPQSYTNTTSVVPNSSDTDNNHAPVKQEISNPVISGAS